MSDVHTHDDGCGCELCLQDTSYKLQDGRTLKYCGKCGQGLFEHTAIEEMRKLRAQLAASNAEREKYRWRKLSETAPVYTESEKDYDEYITIDTRGNVALVPFSEHGWQSWDYSSYNSINNGIEYWMPIPAKGSE